MYFLIQIPKGNWRRRAARPHEGVDGALRMPTAAVHQPLVILTQSLCTQVLSAKPVTILIFEILGSRIKSKKNIFIKNGFISLQDSKYFLLKELLIPIYITKKVILKSKIRRPRSMRKLMSSGTF